MECEILRSPMISYRSLLYSTTVLYDVVSASLSAEEISSAENFLQLESKCVHSKRRW